MSLRAAKWLRGVLVRVVLVLECSMRVCGALCGVNSAERVLCTAGLRAAERLSSSVGRAQDS